jgi:hypothetical protein
MRLWLDCADGMKKNEIDKHVIYMAVNVPATIDMIQEYGEMIIDVPEIRVWVHPSEVGKKGEDYYTTDKTFKSALKFILDTPGAEDVPLIAWKGYELNIFDVHEATF